MSPKSPPNSDTSWLHLFLNRSLLHFLTPETRQFSRSIDHPWDEARRNVIFKILLNNENSTFNHPELSFPFFRRQRFTRARKKIQALREFWDTLYISVISRDGKPGSKPGIYHFCGVIRLPPDSSGNSGDAFNCFLLFPFFPFFFLSKGGPRSFYFALSFLLPGFRQWKRIGRSEWQGRDPLRGSMALSDEFMRDIRAGEWGRVSRESFGNYAGFAPRDFPQFKD